MTRFECEEEQEWGEEQESYKTQTSGRAPDFHPCPPPPLPGWHFSSGFHFLRLGSCVFGTRNSIQGHNLFRFPEGGARQFLPTLKYKQVTVSLLWSLSTCLFFLLGIPRLCLKGEEAEDLAL